MARKLIPPFDAIPFF